MATINISNIQPAGYELLFDADEYMDNLADEELNRIVGGTEPVTLGIAAFAIVAGAGVTGYGIGRLLR